MEESILNVLFYYKKFPVGVLTKVICSLITKAQ